MGEIVNEKANGSRFAFYLFISAWLFLLLRRDGKISDISHSAELTIDPRWCTQRIRLWGIKRNVENIQMRCGSWERAKCRDGKITINLSNVIFLMYFTKIKYWYSHKIKFIPKVALFFTRSLKSLTFNVIWSLNYLLIKDFSHQFFP